MIAAVNVADEIIKWAIPVVGAGILALIRLAYRSLRHLEEVGTKVDDLHRYTRYHLGPNGDSPAIHTRLQALERAHGIKEGP